MLKGERGDCVSFWLRGGCQVPSKAEFCMAVGTRATLFGRRRRRRSDAIGGHSVAQSTLLSRLGTYLEAVLGLGLTLCADLREERRAGEDEDCFERWEKTLFR